MLNHKIKFLIRYILFWLILFSFTRALFIAFYHQDVIDESLINLLAMPYHAFMLDLSMICYILVIPFLVFTIQHFIKKPFAYQTIRIYSFIIACIYLMIAAAEINLFAEWQTKIDYRAIVYLKQPSEVFL